MAKVCGIIAPRKEDMTGDYEVGDRSLASCILKGVHGYGPHVFRTTEGKLIAWEDDDCDCCEPEEDEPCAVFWNIEESDIPEYQSGGPPKK